MRRSTCRWSAEQWSRFTDFGVTLFDSVGRKVQDSPLNYAFGRMEADFEDGHPGESVALRLFPGLAEPGEHRTVDGHGLDPALCGGAMCRSTSLPGGTGRALTSPCRRCPGPLGDAFYPVGLLTVSEGGRTWTREVPLPEPTGPLMR